MTSGNYEWSCFQSQQSAEKCLKAYLYELGYTSITTHSIKMLVKECTSKEKAFSRLKEAASALDAYYIPTRYPNGLDDDLAPVDYYDKEDAERCLRYATSVSDNVKKFLKD